MAANQGWMGCSCAADSAAASQCARVVVVGQGYVGLLLAMEAVLAGHHVVGLEVEAQLVFALNRGYSHVDDVSDERLSIALQRGYRATVDQSVLGSADVVIVCVPTPLAEDGSPDLSAVMIAADIVGRELIGPALVVLESTTHPGTTDDEFVPAILRHGHRLDEDVFVAFSPERVDPGNISFGIRNTPKVVGGVTVKSSARAEAFYRTMVDEVVVAKGAREAELAKLLENTFRHVNIALVNEMLRVSNDLGIDLWDAIRCAETKPFGFLAFRPGPGVGGHCIPVDPMYLSHRTRAKLGYPFRMVEVAEDINRSAPGYVVERCCLLLNEAGLAARGAHVILLGVTYKPGIGDCRESPANPIAAQLNNLGCEIRYHDPYVARWIPDGVCEYERVTELDAALPQADLVVLLQAHPEYKLDEIASSAKRLLDTRGVIDPMAASVTRL